MQIGFINDNVACLAVAEKRDLQWKNHPTQGAPCCLGKAPAPSHPNHGHDQHNQKMDG